MEQFAGLTAAAAWVLAAGIAASAAHAQSGMHKCVDIDARVTYQDAPCAAGTAMGQIARDTRTADPAALREANAEQLRAAQAAEARAGIRVNPDERKIIDGKLQRYLAAAGLGDSEERCRLAGQIGAALLGAKNQPGFQRWKLYADRDCGEENKVNSALLPDASASEPRRQEEPRYPYPGDTRPVAAVPGSPGASGRGAGADGQVPAASARRAATMPIPGIASPPGIMPTPAPCTTPQCRKN